jgi:16S rRNA (cytosine967-C5)-methyltransferase
MFYRSRLRTAVDLVDNYKGNEPLAIYLKKYFATHKECGSTDRREISALCYFYFRLGKQAAKIPTQEAILTAIYLSATKRNELLPSFDKADWNYNIYKSISDKASSVNFDIQNIFPWKNELSKGIDYNLFCESILIQPDLFVRVRPYQKNIVVTKLTRAEIDFVEMGDDAIAMANNTKLDELLQIEKEVVVQDYNSQQVLNYFKTFIFNTKPPLTTVWDCCAASGGKSLLIHDVSKHKAQLTVSDVRPSILLQLHRRFTAAKVKDYKYFISDLVADNSVVNDTLFDVVICDAPCTGSGTWGRTPEQIAFFNTKKIEEYVTKQQQIVSTVIANVKKGGIFVYITCSVFKKENENMVTFIEKQFKLKTQKKEMLTGYDKKADSMFVAVFKK